MEEYLPRFYRYLQAERAASPNTIAAYRRDIGQFIKFLKEDYLTEELSAVMTSSCLRTFVVYLQQQDYRAASIARKISALRSWANFLLREEILDADPFVDVALPKRDKRLPRFLYTDDMEILLAAPDTATVTGKRDQALLELLYASGCRVGELVGLDLADVHLVADNAKVLGKGNKERLIYFGAPAKAALSAYIQTARPELLAPNGGTAEPALFVNSRGRRISPRSVRHILDQYVRAVALQKHVSPHVFRHTFATHLLNGGADLRSVQELLGHVRLSTTQIYTHLTRENLKNIYRDAFPRR